MYWVSCWFVFWSMLIYVWCTAMRTQVATTGLQSTSWPSFLLICSPTAWSPSFCLQPSPTTWWVIYASTQKYTNTKNNLFIICLRPTDQEKSIFLIFSQVTYYELFSKRVLFKIVFFCLTSPQKWFKYWWIWDARGVISTPVPAPVSCL